MQCIERKYPNGLKLLVNKNDSPYACAMVRVLHSVEHETKAQEGVCCVIENLLLNTQKTHSGKTVAHSLQVCGGELFVSTYVDAMEIGVTALPDKLFDAIDVLSDVIFNCDMSAFALDNAKLSVKEMQKDQAKSPNVVAFDLLRSAMFEGTGLSKNVFGRVAAVEKLTTDDVKAFWDKSLYPKNIVVSVSGNVDVEKLYEVVFNAIYSKILKFNGRQVHATPTLGESSSKTFMFKRMKLNQSRVCAGFMTNGEKENKHKLAILAQILSTKLDAAFENIDDVFEPISTVRSFANNGMFFIMFAASPNKIEFALETSVNVLKNFAASGVSKEEFERQVAIYKRRYVAPLEQTKKMCRRTARVFAATGKLFDIEKQLNDIESVTLKDCQTELKLIMRQQSFVSLVGKEAETNLGEFFANIIEK